MKDNKHPHYDLISEWIKDTSKKYQVKLPHEDDNCFRDCNGFMSWNPSYVYREKPREFIKGHWYPCLLEKNGLEVRIWDGNYFLVSPQSNTGIKERLIVKIGDSLGEIKFGE